VVLPLSIALAMYANIDAALSAPAQQAQQGGATMLWVLGKVRLALEWAVVPLFAISLQLPQGALCYWATSSACALAQNHALRLPAARRALGLAPQGGGGGGAATPPAARAAADAGAALPADAAAALVRAAELQARGKSAEAAAALQALLRARPGQPRALFALAQVRSALKEWPAAEQAYLEATRHEGDPLQRARAWFGAGVALHMQREEGAAADAFAQAAEGAGEAGGAAGERLQVRAWVSQATLAQKLGRRGEAEALLRRAAAVEPRVGELYVDGFKGEKEGGG
jgi:tetratricopeptide (TPR) repeat protein